MFQPQIKINIFQFVCHDNLIFAIPFLSDLKIVDFQIVFCTTFCF
jgi:hypothetical protein